MNNQKGSLIIWWVLWLAFLNGVVVTYFFLRTPPSHHALPSSFPWQIVTVPFFLSLGVRWVLLPRIEQAQKALVAFVIGIAFAEACCYFGLFLVPEHQSDFFGLSLLGIAQFLPYYAGRFYRTGPNGAL